VARCGGGRCGRRGLGGGRGVVGPTFSGGKGDSICTRRHRRLS
jgi:hypothetical protein